MRIRFCQSTDHHQIAGLWLENGILTDPIHAIDDVSVIAGSGDCMIYVAVTDDKIVGTVAARLHGTHGWIQHLVVAATHRSQGYGRLLLQAGERWMAARNLKTVSTTIDHADRDTQKFFEALGYNPCNDVLYSRPLRKKQTNFSQAQLDVVITYLEMTERPAKPAPLMPDGNYQIQRLATPSLGFYRYLYDSVGAPWFWTDRRRLSDHELRLELAMPGIEIYVLYGDGEPAGFAELEFKNTTKTVNLAYFGLLPHWIGKGLGQYLLRWAIDYAWDSGARKVTTNTCTLDHPRAIGNYCDIGYRPVRRVHKKITDPRLQGWINTACEPLLPTGSMLKYLA